MPLFGKKKEEKKGAPSGPAYPTAPAYPQQSAYPQTQQPVPTQQYGAPPQQGPSGPQPQGAPPPYTPYAQGAPGQAPPQMYYQPPPQNTVMVQGAFDAGARFDGVSQPNIPPPPPGVMPNAAQAAAMQGHNVIATQQRGDFLSGGSDGGYTIW